MPYHPINTNNNKNWMANLMILLITVLIGITSRGKYTLPKMAALATKVLLVAVRQLLK